MRTLKLLIVAGLLSPAVGCKWLDDMKSHNNQTKKGSGPLPQVAPEQLVGYLNERSGRLQSLQYGDVRMRCFEKGMPTPQLEGNIAAAQPRSFRMTGQGRVGGKVDFGSNPDQFWIYVQAPSDSMYVFASHNDFESGRARLPGGIPFEPDWVMQALGMTTFPPTNTYDVKINDRDRTYILSWPATTPSGLQVRKEVIFDGEAARDPRPQVKKHVVRDAKKDKVIAYAEIKQVKTVQVGSDPRNPTVPVAIQYPTQVVLKWEEQKFEMDLTLENAQVNQPIAPEAQQRLFTRPNISGAKAVDLARFEFK